MYPKLWPSARLGTLVLALGLDWLLAGCGGSPNQTNKPPPLTPSITWAMPAPIAYGTALSATQLDTTASVPGSFAYTPALGTVVSGGTQKLSVTFTPTDIADYTTASASVSIQVNPITPTLNWVTPAAIVYGTALGSAQLDASSGGVSGAFVYSPSAGAVLGAGSQSLSARFTPADTSDYTTAAASVTLTVAKAMPSINWAPTGRIAVGMALTSTQLDATASAPGSAVAVPGIFLYSPAAGAILNSSGPQMLYASFTPADQTDYAAVEVSATLDVLPFGVVAWGDSLTIGDQGNIDAGAYTTELAELITLPVVNDAVNANTTTETGVREGGLATYATVAGGSIPASGGVAVTFEDGWEPVTSRGPAGGIGGAILGVHGLATYASGIYTFTRTTPGSAVSAPGSPQFVVDTPYAVWIPIFWEGRNDYDDPSRVESDIAAEVAFVPPGQTYVILPVLNANDQDEWVGAPWYTEIIALNNYLASIYGTHYLDIRKLLINSYDPEQATDVADFNHDEPPTSLRAIFATATLANSIGPTDTVLTFEGASHSIQNEAVLTIDTGQNAENALVTSVSGNTVTVERDLGGPNIAHAAGAPLSESDPIHLNAKGYQIVANAVAKFLSAYASPMEK